MEPIVMRSAEGVEMELPVASPAPRMLAYVIDVALVYLLMTLVVVLLVMLLPVADTVQGWLDAYLDKLADTSEIPVTLALMTALFQFLLAFHEFLYFSAFETLTRGRTPGKYLVGLRVVDSHGQPTRGTQTLIRNALRLVDALPTAYLVGLIAMLMSPRGQRLGDRAAGTAVIRTDKLPRVDDVPLPEGLTPLALSRQQLALLGEREVRLVRSTLRRAESVPEDRARELIHGAADALRTRLQLPADEAQDEWQLLQRLLLTATRRNGG